MNTDLTPDKLQEHAGHEVVIATYGTPAVNYSLECTTCYEVLADANTEGDQ